MDAQFRPQIEFAPQSEPHVFWHKLYRTQAHYVDCGYCQWTRIRNVVLTYPAASCVLGESGTVCTSQKPLISEQPANFVVSSGQPERQKIWHSNSKPLPRELVLQKLAQTKLSEQRTSDLIERSPYDTAPWPNYARFQIRCPCYPSSFSLNKNALISSCTRKLMHSWEE